MNTPVKKNDQLTVHIEDLTHDGAGVAKVDGYPLFIQGGLPNETAEIHVLKTLKNYGFAKLVNIVDPSPFRVEAPCPYSRMWRLSITAYDIRRSAYMERKYGP